MDAQIIDWVAALPPKWLATPFSYTSTLDGQARILPVWTLVVHFFNHQTHRRGQPTALLSQGRHDLGSPDLP